MAVFPAFKALMFDSFQEQAESAVLRTQMDSGSVKQAQLYSQGSFNRTVTYVFTGTQFEAFKIWWRDDLGLGAGWFDWDDPLDGATKQVMMNQGVYSARPLDQGEGNTVDIAVSFRLDSRGS
ncbi:MAG: hypothetical protein OEY11_12245 [Gammaproteobacteria bacterium]|nr:hypothetical protein [Gammaproteobacteria bacterium]